MSLTRRAFPLVSWSFFSLLAGLSCLALIGCNSGSAAGSTASPSAPQVVLGTINPFASTTAGTTSTAQSVTLTNSGNGSLALSGITISGANASAFADTTTCGSLLSAGNSCTITVTFTPPAAGSFAATLNVADDAAGSPQTLALSGTGTTATIPQAVLTPSSVSFPGTVAGTVSAPQTITLSNPGGAVLSGLSVTVAGVGASVFTESNTCGASLAAGASCTISASFAPAAAGSFTATLDVADNASGSPQTASLTGTATGAPASQAVLAPLSLTFPGTAVGSTASAQNIVLTNPGNLILNITGIAITGANAGSFAEHDDCNLSLAAGASCNISVTFAPQATGALSAAVSVTDDATGSPQTAALTGTGTLSSTAQAVLSPASLTFLNTVAGTTSAAQTITLSNPGALPLGLTGVTLAGTNPAQFAITANTCGSSVAAGGSCMVSVSFTPAAAAASYAATLNFTDSAASSPQALALTGNGVATGTTHTLLTFPESDLSVTSIYNYIQTATKTLDMTMYELVDTTFQQDLVALAAKGVKVRVILDQSLEKSSNMPAYTYLNANGVQAVWANAGFQACHQKTITIDGTSSAIMTLNLTSRYYYDTRDFAVIDTSANDVAAIEATFNNDFANGSTTFATPVGDDLLWSPTNSQTVLVALINSAKHSLNVENEEMSDTAIVNALAAAASRGVAVQVTMTSDGSYNKEFTTLKAAGAQVRTYTESAPLYIHAKVVVVDYGQTTGQQAYVGSENFTNASLNENRELGLTLTDAAVLQALNTTLNNDFAGGTPF